ncbi:MAG TPA: M12 family metallo-peptidase [Thermoanaerobaculia bacterium]|nr:M12 family metallo-peptidase [Thermoanaerobaculia bacterium]
MKSARRLVGALSVVCGFIPAMVLAAADGPVRLAAAAQGQVIDAPGTDVRAEVVTFGEALAPALLRVAPEETVRIAGWPVAPGVRADVRLTRFEIYAPGARIWKVEGDRRTEVPRSRMAFFQGFAEDAPETRVFAGLDPDTGAFQGLAVSPKGSFEIRPFPEAAKGRGHLVTVPEYFLPANGKAEPLSWTCGQSTADEPLDFLQERPAGAPAEGSPIESIVGRVISSLHTVTLAVDTDNEMLQQKFSDNTTNATSYVAALIAALNVIYERDLNIRLLQGTTFLRVSTTPDPYSQPPAGDGSVTQSQLSELAVYWGANNGSVQRGLAMLLSGKSPNPFLSAGRANVSHALCSTVYGYSFSQVFKYNGSTGASDAFVVGHEIGHNFGSPHTHCYSPPIDSCFSGESASCYSGPTSCPAQTTINGVTNVEGTLMSYCHTIQPSGSCHAVNVFHPRTVDLITEVVTPKIGVCVFPLPAITTLSPNNGTTAGGTLVTINGANFRSGATVSFGGTSVAVTFNSSTQLTVTTPAHATGAVGVVVTNPDTASATKPNAFFYAPQPVATDFYTLAPCRVLDTRNPDGPAGGPVLSPTGERSFPIAGSCGVPANAVAVAANVTVISPTVGGYLSIVPGNAFPLGTSILNFPSGTILANNATLGLATDGAGTIRILNGAGGTTHVVLDVTGYYAE